MSANAGALGGYLINTVVIQSVGGTAGWGMTISAPSVVDVVGSANINFTAFVLDTPCYDNTGNATLRFQKAQ
jgi:pyruvate/2-oxoacid:ferredoxin oxidoreductase beta subunit